MSYDFVVLGAGIAGLTAAQELRRLNPEASLLLVDREARLPYKRTKLSKELAAGMTSEQFALFPEEWYAQNRIELALGEVVDRLVPAAHQLVCTSGRVVEYRRLLLANGAVPRQPVGYAQVKQWLYLRNQTQTEALRQRVMDLPEVCILGNGVLGVEIAEQMIKAGKRVRLLSRYPLPLHRDLSEEASTMLKGLLEEQGIELGKTCSGATSVAVAAIGSQPDTSLAAAAGLAVKDGILVDDHLRTSGPDIWAAGDCTEDATGRISHLWHESEYQAREAAALMSGRAEPYQPLPFRLKMEVFGEYYFSMNKPDGTWWDRVEQRRHRRYQCFYFSYDRLSGVVMVNDKDRNKLYEQAVREQWHRDRVMRELSF